MIKYLKKLLFIIIFITISFTLIFFIETIKNTNVLYGDEVMNDNQNDKITVQYGDINDDGSVNVGDGVVIKNILLVWISI